MQHEDMALRIERDAGNFAEVEIGRQMQKVWRGFIRDGRDFLSGGETAGREAESGGAGHGKKPAPRPGRERALVATGAGLPVSVAHGRSLPWSPAHAALFMGVQPARTAFVKIAGRRPYVYRCITGAARATIAAEWGRDRAFTISCGASSAALGITSASAEPHSVFEEAFHAAKKGVRLPAGASGPVRRLCSRRR